MKKKPFFSLILLILIFTSLVACGGSPQTPVTESEAPATIGEEAPISPTENIPSTGNDSPDTTSNFVPVSGDTPMEGCTVATLLPEADPTVVSLFPAVSESDWVTGPEDAAVTIIEYADFQCPACAQFAPVLAQLKKEFPDDLRVVFRHFPLANIHDKATLGVQAAEAAGEQGQFWAMHDLLFQRQLEWNPLSPLDFQTWVIERAGELGLDMTQFAVAFTSQENVDYAQQTFDDGIQAGLPGTPFLLINQRIYDGPTDYMNLSVIIKLYALQKRQFTDCPAMIIDPTARYIATIQTEKGDIVVELFADKAPLAVNNFVFLATNGWYDNITFHRVLQGFMAQSGDPTGTGYGGPGYAFKNETSDLKFDAEGILAMANAGPNSNGAQFFITFGPTPHLDGGYTIFGHVIKGMDVVLSLRLRDPAQGLGQPPGDLIKTILIEQK